jgi:hypothetical protein
VSTSKQPKLVKCPWCDYETAAASDTHAHDRRCYVVLRYIDSLLEERRAKHTAMSPELKSHLLGVRLGRVPAKFSKLVQREAA